MQTAFFEAVINRDDHRILGRRLHALCLYDALFLSMAENPFWVGGNPTLPHLQEAVLICSLPPARLLSARVDPQSILEAAGRALWHHRARQRDLGAECAAWAAYVADFHALPEHWSATSSGKSLRAPWILSLASYIEAHSNMTFEQIMTAPIGLMHWKAEAIAERRGEAVSEIMTDLEIEIGQEQAAAIARRQRSNESSPPSA